MKQLTMSEATRHIAEVARISGAEKIDVMRVIEVAKLDPSSDFRFENWSGISFAGLDLSGFDFTGARLLNCQFRGARISGARFDQAEIGRVIHRPGRPQHDPAEMTAITNLREAADWAAFADPRRWKPPAAKVSDRHLHPGAIFQDAPFAPEMVVVPAGEFTMGSNDNAREKPPHKVTIDAPLAVARFPLTFDDWEAAQTVSGVKHRLYAQMGRGRQPVVTVSWKDAKDYCHWLSGVTGKTYRLLSEAEWEYVCRAGSTGRWSFGADEHNLGEFAWFRSNSGNNTQEVGKKKPNAWGLYDIHGNVLEWCEDNWHPNYKGDPPVDGSEWKGGDPSSRVLRGGSWVEPPDFLRPANRFRSEPTFRIDYIGFRLARTLLHPSP